jgi:hypothetical protein
VLCVITAYLYTNPPDTIICVFWLVTFCRSTGLF